MKFLANYFFGSGNIITQTYTSLTNWCSDNRSILEVKFAMYTSLIPKLMVSTDERVHQFLKSCVKAEYHNRSTREYLNFQMILMALELNSFNYFFQPAIKQLKRDREKEHDNCSKLDKNKKPKFQERSRETNHNMQKNWKLRSNENYETVFRDKVKQCPILSMGCKGCHKFHNKGFCYSDCNNKDSHCKLIGDDKEKFDKRIKQLRGG